MKIAATHIALIMMKPEAYLFFSSYRPCLITKVNVISVSLLLT